MSPQPSRIGKFPQEASGGIDRLVFGEDAQSSLTIPKAVIEQLWAQVTEGTRILARGGLEVGGLLVGSKSFGGAVVVEEIVPLPIEYRYGPSFHMSSSDLAGIQAPIESVQEDQSKAVVGLYRGRTRGDTNVRDSDHQIFDAIEQAYASFEADFRCFFVLAPMSESFALACVTMRHGAAWDQMNAFTLRANPLSIVALPPSTALQQMPRNLQTDPAMQSPAARSAGQPLAVDRVPEHRVAESPAADRADIRPSRIWVYVVACLALVAVALIAVGGYRWVQGRGPQPGPTPAVKAETARTHLGFSASREGPAWKLSWDRAAMDALNPIGAVLSIEDGGLLQQVPLAPADLASGVLFYTPQTNELTFALRIDRGGSHVEEQVRVLEASRTPPKPIDRAPQSNPPKAPFQPPAKAADATALGERLSLAASSVPAATPTPARTPTKEFVMPSTADRGGKSTPAPVSLPPVVTLAVPVAPNLLPVNPSFTPLPARAAQPAVPAPNSTSGPSSTPAPAPIPASAAPAQSLANYVAPRPVTQVSPQAPSIMPSNASQVVVTVDIDVHGKVTKVHPVGENAANAALMISAARAASSWVFTPAQLNGRPVPSQVNLIFKF